MSIFLSLSINSDCLATFPLRVYSSPGASTQTVWQPFLCEYIPLLDHQLRLFGNLSFVSIFLFWSINSDCLATFPLWVYSSPGASTQTVWQPFLCEYIPLLEHQLRLFGNLSFVSIFLSWSINSDCLATFPL